MSARGELFANEDVRDTYEAELDKVFGVGKWQLDGTPFSSLWEVELFPSMMEIPVKDVEDGSKIGTIDVEVKKMMEDDGFGAYLEVEVGDLISIKDKGGQEKAAPRTVFIATVRIAVKARTEEEAKTKILVDRNASTIVSILDTKKEEM